MITNLEQYVAIAGLDWADKKHDICLFDKATNKASYFVIQHSPESIEAWLGEIQAKYPNGRIAICIELSKGPIISALLNYDFIDIFPINPKTLSKYREAFSTSGSKNDPVDAFLQMDFLYRHSDRLKKLKPDSPEMRSLNQMVIQCRSLVEDKVRITNSLTATLKSYFPQALDWFIDKDTMVFCDFIERWPTLEQTKRAHKKSIREFFIEHKSYRGDVIERRIKSIEEATPLTKDAGIIEPSLILVKVRIKQLKLLLEAIKNYDKEIAARFQTFEDYEIFNSLPGAGPKLAPRLLVAFGSQRDKYKSADEISRYIGVAPVTIASGQSSYVRWRYSAPVFLRQTIVEWAGQTIKYSFWARAYYEQQRMAGKKHHTAIRSLSFKWIRILFRCWKNRERYNEATYLIGLQKRQSTLLKTFAQ
jgi:transposase